MKNLKNTKKKLTLMFTLIISVLFLIIGNSFFIFKFYADKSSIEKKYENIEKILFVKKDEIIDFIKKNNKNYLIDRKEDLEIKNILNFTNELFKNKNLNFDEINKTKNAEEILVEGKSDFPYFNEKIILLSKDKNIIYSNIDDSDKIIYEKYLTNKNTIIFEKKLAIIKTNLEEKILIVFINRKYTSSNLILDISYLLLGIVIFSLIFYIIGNKFVKKALSSVEENIEEMNNFIDNAGHELKTPLAAINSSVGLLKEMKIYDKELIQEVINETNKSNEIISALRSLSKISKNAEVEEFYIKKNLKEILISLKNELKIKKIKLNFDTKQKDILINANKNYFYIFLKNIIGNAIKYNKTNGFINIVIKGNILEISDTGIGIPKDEQNKIFERFYRTKNHKKIEGFGLGLSMVSKIAKIYNWKIEVESIENMGTKFKITF